MQQFRLRSCRGFSLKEALVGAFIIFGLIFVAKPAVERSILGRGDGIHQTVNNGHQIYLALFQMANDGLAKGDSHLGWPGDLAQAKVDPLHDLPGLAQRLMDYNYFKPSDLGKVFTAPGIRAYDGIGKFESAHSAFKVYLTASADSSRTVLLATKNFTFGVGLDKSKKPFGDKEFTIVRLSGDAVMYRKDQAGDTRLIGLMPSQVEADPGVETSANVWK